MNTIRPFLSKIRKLFSVFKKAAEVPPSLSYWHTCEFGLICINIVNVADYARALKIHDHLTFDRLLKMPWVLSKPGF